MSALQTSAAIISFVETNLQAVINGSSNQAAFNSSFNTLFANDVKVVVNGTSMSSAQFAQNFQLENSLASNLKVTFIAITVATGINVPGLQVSF